MLLIHKLLVGNRFPPKMFFKAINAHYLLQYRLIPHLPDEQSTLLKGIQSLSFPLTQSLLVESCWRSVSSSNYPPTRKFGDLVIIKEMTKEVECEDERDQVKQEYQWSEYVLNQDSMLGRGPHVRLKNEPPFITNLNFFSICTAYDAPIMSFCRSLKPISSLCLQPTVARFVDRSSLTRRPRDSPGSVSSIRVMNRAGLTTLRQIVRWPQWPGPE